jgi:hypothetical protein
MEARTVGGMKVVEVEPGAPLPPGIPSWAERCDVVEEPGISPAWTRWMVGVGGVGTLGSAIALAFISHWGIAPLLPSLVLLWFGLRPGTTTAVTPSPTGRYMAYENPVEEETAQSEVIRAVALVLGGIALLAAIAVMIAGGTNKWEGVVAFATLGGWLFHHGLGGPDSPRDEQNLPSSLRFRALADPSRPLAELRGMDADSSSEALGAPGDGNPAEPGSGARQGRSGGR